MVAHSWSAEQGVEAQLESGGGEAHLLGVEFACVAEIAQSQGPPKQGTHRTRDGNALTQSRVLGKSGLQGRAQIEVRVH
jgi:hypothetical protein